MQHGQGMGGNMADMQQIHTLLHAHQSIHRSVRNLPDGVESVTTSGDPRVAALIPEHVNAMYARMKEGRLIRGFDPLFVELFRHAGKIDIQVERLKDGVRVRETSRDPYAAKLIQAHAQAVNGFVRTGWPRCTGPTRSRRLRPGKEPIPLTRRCPYRRVRRYGLGPRARCSHEARGSLES
jgi:hypothetical protein